MQKNTVVETRVGVIGATSMVGQSLLPLLSGTGHEVIAYSRKQPRQTGSFKFRHYTDKINKENISDWVCLAPIWTLPEHFAMLTEYGVKRIVALSSTSIFSKQQSTDQSEQRTAEQLAWGERELILWAEATGVEWVILRPTLIYGRGKDRNISEISRLISRFGFFPLFGKAEGLRQPVHVDDVATACMAALFDPHASDHAYEISGAEILPYREMVSRVFSAMGQPERYIHIPLVLFSAAVRCLRILPRYRSWSTAMAERMNADLLFEHTEAARDFGFAPRPFTLSDTDLPSRKSL